MKFLKACSSALIVAASIASITPAKAQEVEVGPYIGVAAGTGLPYEASGKASGIKVEADGRTTFVGGIGLGYDFGNILVEAMGYRSYLYVDEVKGFGRTLSVDEGDWGWGAGIDLEYDFHNDSKWVPYAGVGLTAGWGDDVDFEDVSWGTKATVGLAYEASNKVDVYAEAVYDMDWAQEVDGVDQDFAGQFVFLGGLRIKL